MSTKLETETSASKTIRAYKDQAAKAGLVLYADQSDSGDFPEGSYASLQRFRRNIAITKDHKKIITTMSRQLVTLKDNGKPVKKEYLTYSGYYSGTTYKGEVYDAEFEIGKFKRPKIVLNSNITYDPKTGEPIGNEKILAGQETIYELELPKAKESRKKFIDSIIGEDTHPDNIRYYYRELDQINYEQYRDASFTHSDFCNCSIEELKDMSNRGAGSKSSPYYKDKEGQLRYKKTDGLVTSKTSERAYQ